MISEERMQGHIDQIDSTVHFESRQVLQTWDDQIQSLCFQVKNFLKPFVLSIPWVLSVSVRSAVRHLKLFHTTLFLHSIEDQNKKTVQLNKYETAPNLIQLSQNLTSDCLLI